MTWPKALPANPITWQSLIEEYLTWCAAIGRAKTTIELRRFQLQHLARELGSHPHAITLDDLVTWLAIYGEGWSTETRRSYRAAMCSFFDWAFKFGRVLSNPAAGLPPMQMHKAVPRPADDTAWTQALADADLRTTLILRLAGEAGLRRIEISRVHTRDLIDTPAGWQLVVHGKGDKKRLVPLSEGLAALVRLGPGGHSPGRGPHGWLFPSQRGGHLTAPAVGELATQVLPDGLGLHALRHRFATRAYRGTRNIRAVQQLLGHSNVNTTMAYAAVDDDEMRAAAMAATLR